MSRGIYHHVSLRPEQGHPGQDTACRQWGRGNGIPAGTWSAPAAAESPQPASGGIPPATGRALQQDKIPLHGFGGARTNYIKALCTATCPTLATGNSGSPGTAGAPRTSAGSSGSPPGAPVPALGLNARLRAADSTIWAGRLRRAGLQAAGSSCRRRLFSCSSSLELLGTERAAAPWEGESREAGGSRGSRHPGGLEATPQGGSRPGCAGRGRRWTRPGYLRARFLKESPAKGRVGAAGAVCGLGILLRDKGTPRGMEAGTLCPPPWAQPLVQPGEHSHTLSAGHERRQGRRSPITATSRWVPMARSTQRGERHLPGLAARAAGGAGGPAASARG